MLRSEERLHVEEVQRPVPFLEDPPAGRELLVPQASPDLRARSRSSGLAVRAAPADPEPGRDCAGGLLLAAAPARLLPPASGAVGPRDESGPRRVPGPDRYGSPRSDRAGTFRSGSSATAPHDPSGRTATRCRDRRPCVARSPPPRGIRQPVLGVSPTLAPPHQTRIGLAGKVWTSATPFLAQGLARRAVFMHPGKSGPSCSPESDCPYNSPYDRRFRKRRLPGTSTLRHPSGPRARSTQTSTSERH